MRCKFCHPASTRCTDLQNESFPRTDERDFKKKSPAAPRGIVCQISACGAEVHIDPKKQSPATHGCTRSKIFFACGANGARFPIWFSTLRRRDAWQALAKSAGDARMEHTTFTDWQTHDSGWQLRFQWLRCQTSWFISKIRIAPASLTADEMGAVIPIAAFFLQKREHSFQDALRHSIL